MKQKITLKIISKAIIVLLLAAALPARAQNNVQIMDFAVIPVIGINNAPTDSVDLLVQFKINHPELAASVHFWLGTDYDNAGYMSALPQFVTTGAATYLSYKGQTHEVKDYDAHFNVRISRVVYNTQPKATLFVTTNSGASTNHLFFNL